MQRIALRPLADRRDMLPRLLDRTLEQRKSPLRFGDLVPANQRALLEHDWPGNLDDLRFAADRLAVIVREGSFRKAAEALGLHRKSLHDWADSIGLSAPLVLGGVG
jgi:DNA-binding NtrC family response regulator